MGASRRSRAGNSGRGSRAAGGCGSEMLNCVLVLWRAKEEEEEGEARPRGRAGSRIAGLRAGGADYEGHMNGRSLSRRGLALRAGPHCFGAM